MRRLRKPSSRAQVLVSAATASKEKGLDETISETDELKKNLTHDGNNCSNAQTGNEIAVGSGGGGAERKRTRRISKLSSAMETDPTAAAPAATTSTLPGIAAMPTLNKDVFKNFDKTGKTEFLKYIKLYVKDNADPALTTDKEFKLGISDAIYELLLRGISGQLKKEIVLSTLLDVVAINTDFSSLILDVVNILDCETSLISDGVQDERLLFSQLLKDLDKVIPDKLIKERLEIDTLQDVGIVKQKTFYTKFIKVKTKLYYKQRRFNLFREESEGYAKLITELNQEFEEQVTAASLMDMIKSLIGCFNLDPNRVLDIIIESFESRPERRKIFIPLLRTYMPTGSIICEVLGYKFRYFSDKKTPRSLYHVCALLLKYGVIKIDDIYSWLDPTDRSIINDWEESLKAAHAYVRKLNVVLTNKEKDDEEPEPEKDMEEKFVGNQKLWLCEALLKVGDWDNAFAIINKLPEQCVVVHEPIARALADMIHISIDYLYRKRVFKRAVPRRHRLDDPRTLQKIEAREFSDLRKTAFPMAIALGPSMHYDPVLMYKFIRIMRTIISEMGVDNLNTPPPNTEAESLYYEVLSVLDAALLPSLSYLDCNAPMSEEIWTIMKNYPYHFRYSLYARWKNESYKLHPALIIRRGHAQREAKALMKRVSKENVKPVGRHIGKLTHCAPGYLQDYMLIQVQTYDNLIGPVVDSLKYMTGLSFDSLGYCVVEALALSDRDRFKHDGTSISNSLQNLASFCGAMFKKYNIELSGCLQYVANQLKSQKSLDLLILKEIVQKMAGVESAEEMTNEQLNAMCGGELLRGEAGYFSQVRNTKKSSIRLKDALANNDLAVALCLLMAQQKHGVIFRETANSHLKLVGKLYDQCQDTLVQFGTFLGSTYSVDEYVERLPSIIAMLQEYHINADVAFFLARPMFTHQINQKYDQLRKADPNAKKLTTNQKMLKYLEATNLIMDPIVESVRPLHGPKIWEDISPQFLVTFWSLSMYDLQVPVESYAKEINKLKQLSLQAADARDSNASKNKKEQERYIALMDKLQDERKKQQEHVDKVLQRLTQQKDNWFLSRSAKAAKNETITQFLQLCLFPRCTFTALDALYCAKFVHTIHTLKAANFSTLLCYDRIFCDITYSVTSCTENEATRYGRFLCSLLETVMRWHADQAVFNRECANYPGFVTKFRVSNQFSEANDNVGFENYRHVCHKWHYKITKAVVFCLDSKEYSQIRNAIIILTRILPHFPTLAKLAQIIERKVEKVRDEEKNKRPDLFVIASSYIGQLKLKSSFMLKESDFHMMPERPKESANATSSASAAVQAAVQAAATAASSSSNAGATASTATAVGGGGGSAGSTASTVLSGSTSVVLTQSSVGASKQQISNGLSEKASGDKRDKDRSEKIKLKQISSIDKDRDVLTISSGSTSNRNITIIEIKEETPVNVTITSTNTSDRGGDHDRRSHSRSLRELKKDERTGERERGDHRSSNIDNIDVIIGGSASGSSSVGGGGGGGNSSTISTRSKREKRRNEERYRMDSPIVPDILEPFDKHDHHDHYEREYERERGRDRDRERDRDLSSVSNDSNGSLQHRRSQEYVVEYSKESKRRKMESSSSSSKKQVIDVHHLEVSKKERIAKTKDRKEKLTDEEKDARRERKLGRKRERLEDIGTGTSSDHKRRRDAINGLDDELRERDKYHLREKSPHLRERERSHEKYERDRGGRDDRQYVTKSSRSRVAY